MGNSATIPMLDPKGNVRLIPGDQADAAQKAGGKRAIKMRDPKGMARWIPSDQQDAALKAGGKLVGEATPPDPDYQTPGFFKQAYQALTTPQAPGMFTATAGTPKWLDQAATTGHNVTARAITDVASMVQHPIDALKGSYQVVKEVASIPFPAGANDHGPIAQRVQQFQEEYARDPRTALENAAGDVLGLYVAGKLTDAAGKPIKMVTGKIPSGAMRRLADHQRLALREKFGGGTDFTEKTATKFGDTEARVRAQNQTADERTLAARGTVDERNAELRSKDSIARTKVEQDNRDAALAHKEKTVAQLKEDAEKIRVAKDKRWHVENENRTAALEHKGAVETTMQAREGAEQSVGLRDEATQDLAAKSKMLDDKVDAAETKARAENKTRYDDLRKANSDEYTTSPEPLQIAVEGAIQGADPATSALFRSILKHKPGEANVAGFIPEPGAGAAPKDWEEYQARQEEHPDETEEPPAIDGDADGLTFGKLQQWRTYLNSKMTGNLDGNLLQAYRRVLKAIDASQQAITDQTGTTKDLKVAQAGHRQLMETFKDSPNVKQTVATKALSENAPAHVKAEAQAKRMAMLAKYDSSILDAHKAVADATEHLGKFQPEDRLRKGLKQAPDRPEEKPLPEVPVLDSESYRDRPQTKPYDQPSPTIPYKEPESLDAHQPAPDITAERKVELNKNLKKYGATGQWVWRLIAGSTLKAGVSMLSGGAEGTGQFAADLLIGQGALHLITNALRSERALTWLARPSLDDLAAIDTLPPTDAVKLRQALTGLAVEDARKGGRATIQPKMASFLGPANVALIKAAFVGNLPKTAEDAKRRVAEARAR